MSANYGGCPPDGAVVIGIGPDGSPAALAFAVEESCRSSSPLHLVHVLQIGPTEGFAGELQGAIEEADFRIQQSLGCARQLVAGAVPVSAERVDTGSLVTDLVDRASRGKMLVLEHRRQSRVRRLVTGSTVAGCAARSEVPVVAVPEAWRPSPGVDNVVTVGVQNLHEAEALIRRGIAEAKTRDGRVVVMHAWHVAGGYDSVVADSDFRSDQERQITRTLSLAMEAARREGPDVPIQLCVRHSIPARALLAASESSQLLIIGRRHHRQPIGSHLGPVARAVLQSAIGPVLLNPDMPREVQVSDSEVAVAVAPESERV